MLWLGLPVRMSCPQVRRCSGDPPMVTCYTQGMVVKIDWPLSEIKVNGEFWLVLFYPVEGSEGLMGCSERRLGAAGQGFAPMWVRNGGTF